MSRGIFVTGTGTDIGKTYITGLILKKLREAGLSAAYFKAAVSGHFHCFIEFSLCFVILTKCLNNRFKISVFDHKFGVQL